MARPPHNNAGPRSDLASLVSDFRKHGEQIAVVSRNGLRRSRYSYARLARLAGRFAALLAKRGIGKGERVLLWAPNGPEWIGAFFGCVLRGVLPVPLDNAGSPAFAARVEQDTSPKLIVASLEHIRALSSLTPVLAVDEVDETLPAEGEESPVELGPQDPLQIIFTSGTTGDPKGIVHTHANVLASLLPIEQEIAKYRRYERIFHPLRFLHTLPLSHVFGQFMGLWIPPLIAAEVHFEDRLIASEVIHRIREERISVLAAVPRVLDLLRDHLRQRYPDLASRQEALRGAGAWKRWWKFRDVHRLFGLKFWAMVCGGAALPAELEEFWSSLGFVVVQGYGMTETTALVSLNHPFRASKGSLGEVLPGREVQVSKDGEVLVRGDTVSRMVWEEGRARERDSDWLATGDLAELDAAGNLRYRGRKKEVIVTAAGLNIYPEDLEAALVQLPEVKACAVIEAQGAHGPEPVAVLVLRDGDARTAVETANRTLAEYQRIRKWTTWPDPDLPRTSTGKVLRREVARVLAGSETDKQVTKDSLESLLNQVSRQGQAGTGTDRQELTLDSLARVELQAGIEERFGITVDDAAMQNVRTLDDLRALLRPPAPVRGAPPLKTLEQEKSEPHHIYPTWPWAFPIHAARGIFLDFVIRGFTYVLAKPKVVRQTEAFPQRPVLIYANHITAMDPALVLYALPGRLRRNTAIAMAGEILIAWRKRRYYNYRFLNWISPFEYLVVTALFNVFPLPQKSGFRKSFAHAARAMDRRYNVLVFPEGTRATDENILKFMSGAGLLWSELRCPALPVFLAGVGELKRTQEHWFRSRKLAIYVGEPIVLPAGVQPEEAAAILEKRLRDLAETATSGYVHNVT